MKINTTEKKRFIYYIKYFLFFLSELTLFRNINNSHNTLVEIYLSKSTKIDKHIKHLRIEKR